MKCGTSSGTTYVDVGVVLVESDVVSVELDDEALDDELDVELVDVLDEVEDAELEVLVEELVDVVDVEDW